MNDRPQQTGASYGYSEERKGLGYVTSSATIIVPLLIERFAPKSIVDVGCGLGDWLSEFRARGVASIQGMDGKWVPKEGLKIPPTSFREIDFYEEWPAPIRADMATCFEVAEHVSEPVGKKMVAYLCACSDLVAFSAAIPGQGGYEHINEQYQDYWLKIFKSHGFEAFDVIRPQIWHNRDASAWYRQNMLIYANAKGMERHNLKPSPFVASVVHPEYYNRARDPKYYSLKGIAKNMPSYFGRLLTKAKLKSD